MQSKEDVSVLLHLGLAEREARSECARVRLYGAMVEMSVLASFGTPRVLSLLLWLSVIVDTTLYIKKRDLISYSLVTEVDAILRGFLVLSILNTLDQGMDSNISSVLETVMWCKRSRVKVCVSQYHPHDLT